MQPGIEIDFVEHYEQLAEHVARLYGRPIDLQVIRALRGVYQETIEEIEANPHLFAQRVNEYCYGLCCE